MTSTDSPLSLSSTTMPASVRRFHGSRRHSWAIKGVEEAEINIRQFIKRVSRYKVTGILRKSD
jgi:hypothetical protein